MDALRLVALVEPVASTGPARVAGRAGIETILEVLDRVIASRLDRAGAAVRWGIGVGRDDASAATCAADALGSARGRGRWVGFATGDPWRDALLADLVPALAALLDDLTPRQAEIAGRVLVDGVRQAEVAAALGVSRATVSVAVARGRLPAIAGARRAVEALLVGPSGRPPGSGDDAVPAGGSR